MKKLFWRFIAYTCSRPRMASLLILIAKRTPYYHLGGYMHRWWLMPRWMLYTNASGHLDVKSWVPFAVRIHHIQREDRDTVLHDHPWSWRTIILDGWYCEEDVFGIFHFRDIGDTSAKTAETFHRIDEVSPGGVWTLFITGRKHNLWGFMDGTPPRKIYYRHYRSPNGRGA